LYASGEGAGKLKWAAGVYCTLEYDILVEDNSIVMKSEQ